MRSKTIILLVLALGCGLVASVGISQMLQHQDTGPAADTAPVWVVKTDIKSEEALTMQNLALEQWPKEKIPPGSLGKLEEVDGKRARVNLYQGEPILAKKLLTKDQQGHGFDIPKGWRLFTVQGDAINSNGGLLQPGDRVDVMVFVQKGNVGIDTGTKTILQDIKVFAINDQVRSSEDKGAESITAKTVTLLVTPSAAEKLALANEIGKIRLVQRAPDDTSPALPNGTNIGALFGSEKMDRGSEEMNRPPANPRVPAVGLTALLNEQLPPVAQPEPLAQSPTGEQFSMQIIRGTEISQTEFTRKFDDPTHWANGSLGSESTGNSQPEPVAPPVVGKKAAAKSNDGNSKPSAAKLQDAPAKGNTNQDSSASHS